MDAAACKEWAWEWLVLMAKDGWKVELAEAGNADARKEAAKKRQEEVKEKRIKAVANAKDLEDHQVKELSKRRLTQAEADALRKKALRDAYKEETKDPDALKKLVEMDQDGKLRNQIERLEMIADDTDTRTREREKRFMGEGVVLDGDLRAVGLERELYRRALFAVGVCPFTLTTDAADKQARELDRAEHYTYNAKSDRVKDFVEWLENWREPLAGVVKLPTQKRLKSNPLQFLGTLIKRCGLETECEGDNGARRYRIPSDKTSRLEALRGWVVKRPGVTLTDKVYTPCKTKYESKSVSGRQTHLDQTLGTQGESHKPDTQDSYIYKKQSVSAHPSQGLQPPVSDTPLNYYTQAQFFEEQTDADFFADFYASTHTQAEPYDPFSDPANFETQTLEEILSEIPPKEPPWWR